MDNINFNIIDNLTYVERVIKLSDFDFVLYIDLTKTSKNIKDLLNKYQPEFSNFIKINSQGGNKYKIIDDNNNFRYKSFININMCNKLIKIELIFSEKYLNFYIKNLIVYDKKEVVSNRKFNVSKKVIVKKLIKSN
jgi:hypothetical protein